MRKNKTIIEEINTWLRWDSNPWTQDLYANDLTDAPLSRHSSRGSRKELTCHTKNSEVISSSIRTVIVYTPRWRCSLISSGRHAEAPYRFLRRYIRYFKSYSNLSQISKWRTGGSVNPGIIHIDRCGMSQGIRRHQDHNFLTNDSEVMRKNSLFSYLMTHRWRCHQIWHGPPFHGRHEAYQISSRLIKEWPRYSFRTNFASISLSSRINYFWIKKNIKILFSHFYAAHSKDHMCQIS